MNIFQSNWSNPASIKTTARFCARASRMMPGHALCLAWALTIGLAPSISQACACGCGVYEVGTSSMLPTGEGGMAYVDFDYQDQNHNWSGGSQASAADNPDKDIRTSFYTLGLQDMFDRTWGLRLEIPYEQRFFKTTGGATGDDIVALNFSGVGDIRIQGIYTGFSPDMSAGLMFGLKLPTGSYTKEDAYDDIDRDTEIGTGSTDILLGGFDRFNVGTISEWSGFAQAQIDVPVLTQAQYHPGTEVEAAVGLYYNGWRIGNLLLSPMGQVKASYRSRDTGSNATSPVASGFERLLLSPGIEMDAHPVKVYADIELPVYQHFTGNQLASSIMFRVNISYMF